MNGGRHFRPWQAGFLVLPMAVVFIIGGGKLGMLLGVATAATILVVASRAIPDVRIEVAEAGPGVPSGVLVLALAPIGDPRIAGVVASMVETESNHGDGPGVLVLAPAKTSRLDRWADDLGKARFESQRLLTVSLASLAAAGVEAEGRVGDGDPLRAAEDALRTYAATGVVVVAREGEERRKLEELERRLELPLRRVAP